MLIRVATRDAERAKLLVDDLVSILGDCVSVEASGAVQVEPHSESNGTLVHTLGAVERWLDRTRILSAEVWVDERSYTLERRRDPC
jgi:hypothetical protein